MTKALFLDRDGVINRMVKYDPEWDSPKKPEDVVLVDGIVKVIESASKKGLLVVEITNRPEVAKGCFSQALADAIEARVHQLLSKSGARVDKVYTCPHHPNGVVPELTMACECRKPKPGLLLRAARELNIDLTRSVFLGDKASDIEAGKAAGSKTILYLHQEDELQKVEAAKNSNADYKVSSMSEILSVLPILLGIDQ